MATKFNIKNTWQKCNAIIGSKVIQWSTWVKQGSNIVQKCPMSTKLVERTPEQSEVQYWCQMSYRGQLGSTRGQIAQECNMATKVGRNEVQCWGRKSYRFKPGQPGVKLLRNTLWLTNLVGRTHDRSKVQFWSKVIRMSAGVNQRSTCLEMPFI